MSFSPSDISGLQVWLIITAMAAGFAIGFNVRDVPPNHSTGYNATVPHSSLYDEPNRLPLTLGT